MRYSLLRMKNALKYFAAVLTVVSMFMTVDTSAQYYRRSFGVRLGNQFAADYKMFFTASSALDVNLGLINPFVPDYQFVTLFASYNYHFDTGVERLAPYIGGGLSAGIQFGHWDRSRRDRVSYFMSADLPLGVEYRLARKPVVFCFEWSPKFQFLGEMRFIPHSVSAGVRFIFPELSRR